MFFSLICLVILFLTQGIAWGKGEIMAPLSPEEAYVIEKKGTEAPFSGSYWDHKEKGTYTCRRCGTELYKASDKFDSGCGWPSFDDEIPGAVKRLADADGKRTEIICASCNGHLGHVFLGENFTTKNTRHCVNSLSLKFIPEADAATVSVAPTSAVALFAGGCFWGIEDTFSKVPGVSEVISGYSGGETINPTYEQVSTGRTGHAETVQIIYDPAQVDYATLARLFFEIHDPEQIDRQGPDVGSQYRSAIFYGDEEQKKVAEDLAQQLIKRGWNVATQIAPAGKFYAAEEYHQDFTARTGRGACHVRVPRFADGK